MSLDSDLVGAVDRDEISAWYQPQVDLASGRIVALEALSRWRHPLRGLVAPSSFIPLAEGSGLIHEIGDFMLGEACRCAADWLRYDIEVAVNVSAAQLGTNTFFNRLLSKLEEFSLSPNSITVEITESLAIADRDTAAARLGDLRRHGIDISIDDFGAGQSSIAQVLALPATEVKLDRTLVHGDLADSVETMTATIALAHERGMRVVAEGIETEEHFELVRGLGCDRGQGYLIGTPRSEEETNQLLASMGSTGEL